MRFVVTGPAPDDTAIPARLSTIERLDPGQATVHREFEFSRGTVNNHRGWVINGEPFDPLTPLLTSPLGRTEIWRLHTDLHHPVHVHLEQFQVLSRRGREPGPFDGGWKDTVDMRPGETMEIAIRFTDYPGRYMLHCHNLEHEDMAMMAAFDVTPT